MEEPPPPPPPPHGSSPRPPGAGLPDGNYDIFIIPPHSAGSGFLYLPSMQPHRNSFLAGVASTLLAVGLYTAVAPIIKQWLVLIAAGGAGIGVTVLVMAVGALAWVLGKTQAESSANSKSENGGSAGGNGPHQRSKYTGPQPNGWQQAPPPPPQPEYQAPPPPPPQPEPQPRQTPKASNTQSAWEKAREETRKREEERRRAEELKKKREEAQKVRDEAERAAKAKAEKEKWEQARAREKETREREARERIAREREARVKEQRDKEQKEREIREEADKKKSEWEKAKLAEKEKADRIRAAAAAAASVRSTPTKTPTSPSKYERPTAKSQAGTDTSYSYRPYDKPKTAAFTSSASSISGLSESSYAHSVSTARTTPPPSMRGPYSTTDPDKIQIKAVYLFSDNSPTKPLSQLVANEGPVTDGLILHIKTEGLFIDDDIRGVPQREWDVKAWTLKLVEDGMTKAAGCSLHVVRATTRDTENKKYTFILDESEAWKVAVGLQRLRKGSQVRSLGMNGMKDADVKGLLGSLGWL